MWIKFWAKVYQRTGWYPWWIKYQEYKHIMEQLDSIYASYRDSEWELDTKFSDYVGISKGMWQAKHEFYRPWRKCKWLRKKKD